jgi:hypothetical protein
LLTPAVLNLTQGREDATILTIASLRLGVFAFISSGLRYHYFANKKDAARAASSMILCHEPHSCGTERLGRRGAGLVRKSKAKKRA